MLAMYVSGVVPLQLSTISAIYVYYPIPPPPCVCQLYVYVLGPLTMILSSLPWELSSLIYPGLGLALA